MGAAELSCGAAGQRCGPASPPARRPAAPSAPVDLGWVQDVIDDAQGLTAEALKEELQGPMPPTHPPAPGGLAPLTPAGLRRAARDQQLHAKRPQGPLASCDMQYLPTAGLTTLARPLPQALLRALDEAAAMEALSPRLRQQFSGMRAVLEPPAALSHPFYRPVVTLVHAATCRPTASAVSAAAKACAIMAGAPDMGPALDAFVDLARG